MNNNVKQILTSLTLIAIAILSFIIFAPLFVFLIIFLMVSSFFIRRKIIKENPEFFRQYKSKKGRVIDQENNDFDSSNQKLR
ncbi:hypothetical protein FM755_06420 [Francisella tularensis]|uniref:Uncharacterized protein n=9 Tax=Francisella tularensis TaxID=263 RepID=Q5NFF4_FRATT|nr:hypothetical protein [Francisella tularensis]ACD30979.1 conserved hypothetical protein [Francisella tularensis subsp. mediasiatica FSC147]AFX70835.1 hypothetical protein F92_06515 [Francisella tularensis subsp. holarctica F92]AHH46561.1 hypothetical protein X557_06140 [Francisella tularensis subsp. holarctica PHIT-FT049]EBA52736.1 hypothetical protein FTHG_01117 [Francisella tularensis subsp. holarctica 257]ABK90178.1 protein of unknown function [Francisella tularensis subsp. novicida U112]